MSKVVTKRNFKTIADTIVDLASRGYTFDFSMHPTNDSLICKMTSRQLYADEFEIHELHHFVGVNDDGNGVVVFAISALKYGVKGFVQHVEGIGNNTSTSKVVEKLEVALKSLVRNDQENYRFYECLNFTQCILR